LRFCIFFCDLWFCPSSWISLSLSLILSFLMWFFCCSCDTQAKQLIYEIVSFPHWKKCNFFKSTQCTSFSVLDASCSVFLCVGFFRFLGVCGLMIKLQGPC
jgi:hypothetical protein